MKIDPNEIKKEEDGILFNVIRINADSYDIYDIKDYVKEGYCKVILRVDNSVTRTFYFNNKIETSKEKILQDERMKSLRR
jgi:hypothetical protein